MGFINPAAFIFSIFLAGLVLLYLWERQQRRLDVPSMLLWQAIPEAVVRRRRFQPDNLFWLQLAGMAALLFGLANPYLHVASQPDHPDRLILVIDLSASMQTAEGESTRLDLAREQAIGVIRAMPPDGDIMVIGAAREPTIIAPFDRDHESVIEVIEKLRAKDVSTHLEPALAIAQRASFQSDVRTAIHAFTDVPRDSVGARWRDGVSWWPAGTNGDNLAIADVQTTQGVLQNHREMGARVAVQNYGTSEKHGSLTVRIDGALIAQELFTAPPQSTQSFHFPQLSAFGLLEASLQVEDALALDNHWRTWLPRFRPIRIVLVDATPELANAMSRLDEAAEAIIVDKAPGSETAGDPDIIVYHRTTPESLPADAAALLIAPNTDLTSRKPASELREAAVVDWNDGHEVLRGIDPRLIHRFATLQVLQPPPWGETVLSVQSAEREVPALVVGKPGSRRAAILAADLGNEPFLSSDREPLLLLVLNLIDWLADQRSDVAFVRTGESKAIADQDNPAVEVIDPTGASVQIDQAQVSLGIDYAGTYQVVRQDGARTNILANFQDSEESDIGRKATEPYTATSDDSEGAEALKVDRGFGAWLYVAAALLLLAEWIVATRSVEHG